MKKLNVILFLLGAVFLAFLVRNIGAGSSGMNWGCWDGACFLSFSAKAFLK